MTEVSQQLIDDFNQFRDDCIALRNLYNTFQTLFDTTDDTENVLRRSAALFFEDLNVWLIKLFYIDVCRLTEPAGTGDKRQLTTRHFVNELKKERDFPAIEELCKELDRYRELVRGARNKLLAHGDLITIRKNCGLGIHTHDDAECFFKNLNDFTDEVGRALGVDPLDYRTQSGRGDVRDLIRLLRGHDAAKAHDFD